MYTKMLTTNVGFDGEWVTYWHMLMSLMYNLFVAGVITELEGTSNDKSAWRWKTMAQYASLIIIMWIGVVDLEQDP